MNDFDHHHIWHPYAKIPNQVETILVNSADGVYLNLADGKTVIDGMSSWWSAIHGYNHPVLNQAIISQLGKMAHVMFGGLTHDAAIELAKTLLEITPKPLNKVFFSDSGSIAVELSLKMALQYYQQENQPNKHKFIALTNGYHGDTFGAMSVSNVNNSLTKNEANFFAKQPTMHNSVEALQDLRHILQQNHQQIAAVILEPMVQGAGGMNFFSAAYLQGARKLCDEFKILLIVDEIATGFGRTGRLFACEHAQIVPDIICLGKALTGGYLTLAATLTSEKIANQVGTLMHGPTFMANPLACAVANANIKLLLNTDWKSRVERIETLLNTHLLPLKNHPLVKDARVMGGIGVVEMKDDIDVAQTQQSLIDNGVWLRPYGKLLYTMPPFIITDSELLTIIKAIKNSIA